MKPVYIIGSNKGGVGKSLLTMALLDYFIQIEQSCFLVETESRLMDVNRSYNHLPFAVLDLSCELGSIGLIDLGDRHQDKIIIVNATATSLEGITKYSEKLITDLAVINRPLITLWAMDRLTSSLGSLERYINIMRGASTHVVLNSFFGDLSLFSYQDSAVKTQVELTGKSLVFPLLNSRICEKLFNEDLTIEEAATGMLLGYRSIINNWRKTCRAMFDTIAISNSP
jgi:hypothetical protein